MGDAGAFSGIHHLLSHNKALELELQRVKGTFPNPLAVAPGFGGACDQQLGALLLSNSGNPDARCIASGGKAQARDSGMDLQLLELERSNGGTQPARQNAKDGVPRDSVAMECADNPVVDDRVTEFDFRPPVAGVGLEKYISAAILARNGHSKGTKSGGVKRALGGRQGAAADDDPFPPLPRSAVGILELGGETTSSRTSHSVELVGLQDVGGSAVQKSMNGEANKISWTDLLRSSKPDNVCVDLHYVEPTIIDGEACAVFSLEEEAENLKQWQNTLLCYVVGKSPTYYQFLKAMQRQWNPPGGLEMFSRENGLFFCKFGSESDMKKVIKDGPWYMDGKLVVVKKFSGETKCEEDMLSSIPIWVKLPCLPVQWWSIEGVSKVVSPLGHPLYFDLTSASKSRIAYARCCVEVAMEKTLPSSVLCMGGDKVKKRQNISYDWVPKRCSACKAFDHMVAECGDIQRGQHQEGKDGWNNNKKMGKGQQIYRPKEKSQIIESEDQLKSITQKEGGGVKGVIYKTNQFNSRNGTIKATSTNQLLVDMEEGDMGGKRDGDNKGNHKYFSSEDEVEEAVDLSPRKESQEKSKMEDIIISHAEEEGREKTSESDPCATIKEMEVEIGESRIADEDTRDREARGSGEELGLEAPSLGNNEVEGSIHVNQESEDEIQESESEKEEEDSIRRYGQIPAECGMPPSLTVSNPKYKGEIEVPKESKKVKKRATPAPERPAGSRTTRHSFKVG